MSKWSDAGATLAKKYYGIAKPAAPVITSVKADGQDDIDVVWTPTPIPTGFVKADGKYEVHWKDATFAATGDSGVAKKADSGITDSSDFETKTFERLGTGTGFSKDKKQLFFRVVTTFKTMPGPVWTEAVSPVSNEVSVYNCAKATIATAPAWATAEKEKTGPIIKLSWGVIDSMCVTTNPKSISLYRKNGNTSTE